MLRIVFILAMTGWAATASADVLYLANGGRIEGELLNPDESPRRSYVVRTHGGRLTLAEDQVRRVVVKTAVQRNYEALLPTLPDTVEAHLDIADKCERAGLKDQREFHLEQVVRLDPDHDQARHALGYSRVDGRWVRQDDWMNAQGYVRYRGGWRLPQELALEEAADTAEQQTVHWRRQLKIWRSWIIKGRDRVQQGQQAISAIRDPRAAEALADLLDNDDELRELKLLYIEVLGNMSTPAGTRAFIKHALEDAHPRVRESCRDRLAAAGASEQALPVLLKTLRHEQQAMVHRAAAAISRLQDPAATLPLIDALITEHKVVVGGGGGIQPSFSNQGSGLSFGGGPQIEEKEFQNEPVLHALTALHRGVNFGYNKKAWKNWYVARHTPPKVNLRRGD